MKQKIFYRRLRNSSEVGSVALEQLLLLGAVLMVVATALPIFFQNMGTYFDYFNEAQ